MCVCAWGGPQISFKDNETILDLIENSKNGIMRLLEDAVITPTVRPPALPPSPLPAPYECLCVCVCVTRART